MADGAVNTDGETVGDGGASVADGGAIEADGGPEEDGVIAIFTRVSNPDGRSFYLHLMRELPASRRLDNSLAVEFGNSFSTVGSGAVYVSDRDASTVPRWDVGPDLEPLRGETVSLQALGVGYVNPVSLSNGQPYNVDPTSGLARFDPDAMVIADETPIPESVLTRSGIEGFPWILDVAESNDRAVAFGARTLEYRRR